VRDEKDTSTKSRTLKSRRYARFGEAYCYPKTAEFEPEKFEDHYEEALVELINAKRQGKTIGAKPRPKGENVVDLMDALKKSLATEAAVRKEEAPEGLRWSEGNALPIEGKSLLRKRRQSLCRHGRKKAG